MLRRDGAGSRAPTLQIPSASLSGYKLTIRHGPKVKREKFAALDAAVEALRAATAEIRADGGLPEVTAFRTYEPSAQVHARLEISTGRILRSTDAGIDVMGDGGLVAFRGGISREPIEPREGQTPFDAVADVFRT